MLQYVKGLAQHWRENGGKAWENSFSGEDKEVVQYGKTLYISDKL